MKYKVDGWNNFCRVFLLPEEYPEGYCFDGGKDVNFVLEDWFNPVVGVGQAACTKEVFLKEVGEIPVVEVDLDELSEKLVPLMKQKNYVIQGRKYLIIFDFGGAVTFDC